MPSLWDSLFGAAASQPTRPPSRGALLGMNYQAMPDTSQSIEDRRPQGHDYTVDLRRSRGDWTADYWPSDIQGADPWSGGHFGGYDPLVASPLIAARGVNPAPGAYAPSFQQNFRPPRRRPISQLDASDLPSPRSGSDSDLPYIGAHLPWAPGDPGWTPPLPPTRGTTLNSNPWGF